MKKIAAVIAAGALTLGVTAVSERADAYGVKPTLCQILGPGHNADPWRVGRSHTYPTQFFVKAPGGRPKGTVSISFSGAANVSFVRPLLGGSTITRIPVRPGKLNVKMSYAGSTGFAPCSASWSTTIKY